MTTTTKSATRQAQAAVRLTEDGTTGRVVHVFAIDIVGGDHDDPQLVADLARDGLEIVCLDGLEDGSVRRGSVVVVDSTGYCTDVARY